MKPSKIHESEPHSNDSEESCAWQLTEDTLKLSISYKSTGQGDFSSVSKATIKNY